MDRQHFTLPFNPKESSDKIGKRQRFQYGNKFLLRSIQNDNGQAAIVVQAALKIP